MTAPPHGHDERDQKASADRTAASGGKATGQRGLMFYIRRVSRTGLNRATARGGYYASGLGGSGNTYTLVRQGEEWIVTDDQMDWIS